MEVVLGLDNIDLVQPSVITVGNFDGIHLGHQKLLDQVVTLAQKLKVMGTLVTFDRHPRAVVSSSAAQKVHILTNLDEKVKNVELFGLDRVVIIKFTREFSELSYQQFVNDVLINKLGMQAIVVGHDHAFGRDRAGNLENLEVIRQNYHFEIFEIGPYKLDGVTVSSTRIRECIAEGRVDMAASMLGRLYSISGIVVRGEGRGKKLSFPTANISPENQSKLIPGEGVYAVDCTLGDKRFRGMANIGYKPTFGSRDKTIEVHLFDFSEDIYGEQISVEFLKRLRAEKKFKNEHELIKQLNRDKKLSYKL